MYIEMEYAEKLARASIVSVPGVGSGTLRHLLSDYGSARRAWSLSSSEVSPENAKRYTAFFHGRKRVDPKRLENTLKHLDISLTVPGERAYPVLLSTLSSAPPVLFYRGTLDGAQNAVALVGARRATAYGKAAATYLSKEIAARGFVVVSGLARGIDRAAHEGALSSGVTWAFLSGGLEQIYPPEHKKLAEMILEQGALLSEYAPGTPVQPHSFPARNRLISGSALGVIVAEAAEKSGSLITVDFALEQGRDVFAVPGPIFSSLSKGCHNLLRMGAHIAETADDVLQELSVLVAQTSAPRQTGDGSDAVRNQPDVPEEYSELFNCLSDTPSHIDHLVVQTNLPPQKLATGLLHLELAGYIQRLPGQHFIVDRRRQISLS